jgi:hypothetical protein
MYWMVRDLKKNVRLHEIFGFEYDNRISVTWFVWWKFGTGLWLVSVFWVRFVHQAHMSHVWQGRFSAFETPAPTLLLLLVCSPCCQLHWHRSRSSGLWRRGNQKSRSTYSGWGMMLRCLHSFRSLTLFSMAIKYFKLIIIQCNFLFLCIISTSTFSD